VKILKFQTIFGTFISLSLQLLDYQEPFSLAEHNLVSVFLTYLFIDWPIEVWLKNFICQLRLLKDPFLIE